ncbi:MAG TPA: sigma-54 dependent transcriptional regulator [Nitrospirales bacterium]|jgi:DNA-binding NtrC family response regulator
MAHRILIVDDEEASRNGLRSLLASAGYEVEDAADGSKALEKARAFRPAVVITDIVMPGQDGLALLKALQEEFPFVSVILLTGQGSIESAVAAMKQGAYDYLTKPVDIPRLKVLVRKALEKAETLLELSLLRQRLKTVWGMGRLIGKSAAIQEVYRLIELAAPTSAAVLILGESGTGKELVARRLHELSSRRSGPFIAVNCSAIPETLLESEIFGHEKGAFTGALEKRIGCFELAHEGTIFLDEVAEMSPATQAKFLRILQDGMVRRIGAKTEVRVDARVIAATNKAPDRAIKEGHLREDLYYRLNVFCVSLPPLRQRKEDIPLLIEAFLEEFNAKYDKHIKGADDATLKLLMAHSWPGNVRELRNVIERAAITCEERLIALDHLPSDLRYNTSAQSGTECGFPVGTTIEQAEQSLILSTLAALKNNKTRTADVLGISLKTLHNKLERFRR